MDLHLIGGFLGSGKTTAIAAAARLLVGQGKRVGVVTNDQGKYLVDTAFFQLSDVPTVEVTGGCFCCNYDDLEKRIDQIRTTQHPDVLFAESVGSCADLVATVIKPLLELRAGANTPRSYSVFVDARLLRPRLNDLPLPFSDAVVYIFDKQIEEAGVLVVNKIDLLPDAVLPGLKTMVQERFPGKVCLFQNSLDSGSVSRWVDLLDSGTVGLPQLSLDIDYQRYGAGEARLAWLDEAITLLSPEVPLRDLFLRLFKAILSELDARRCPVGHLKFVIQGEDGEGIKLSFPTLVEAGWEAHIPELPGKSATLLLNARVEMDAAELHGLVQRALDEAVGASGASYHEADVSYFHPNFPRPTHRVV